ncbi:MAG: hypothetical protein WA005_03235 [Candidatus Binataceae bacterium]
MAARLGIPRRSIPSGITAAPCHHQFRNRLYVPSVRARRVHRALPHHFESLKDLPDFRCVIHRQDEVPLEPTENFGEPPKLRPVEAGRLLSLMAEVGRIKIKKRARRIVEIYQPPVVETLDCNSGKPLMESFYVLREARPIEKGIAAPTPVRGSRKARGVATRAAKTRNLNKVSARGAFDVGHLESRSASDAFQVSATPNRPTKRFKQCLIVALRYSEEVGDLFV